MFAFCVAIVTYNKNRQNSIDKSLTVYYVLTIKNRLNKQGTHIEDDAQSELRKLVASILINILSSTMMYSVGSFK